MVQEAVVTQSEQPILESRQTVLKKKTLPWLRQTMKSPDRPHGVNLAKHILGRALADLYPVPKPVEVSKMVEITQPPVATVKDIKEHSPNHTNGDRLTPTQLLHEEVVAANQRAEQERRRAEELGKQVLELTHNQAAYKAASELAKKQLEEMATRNQELEKRRREDTDSLKKAERVIGQLETQVKNQEAASRQHQELYGSPYYLETNSPLYDYNPLPPPRPIAVVPPQFRPSQQDVTQLIDQHEQELFNNGKLNLHERSHTNKSGWKRWIEEHLGRQQQLAVIPDPILIYDNNRRKLFVTQIKKRSPREAIAGTALGGLILAGVIFAGIASCQTTPGSANSRLAETRSFSTSIEQSFTPTPPTLPGIGIVTETSSKTSSSETATTSLASTDNPDTLSIYIGTDQPLLVDTKSDNHIGTGETVEYVFTQPDLEVGQSTGNSDQSDLEGFAVARTAEFEYFKATGKKRPLNPTNADDLKLIQHYADQPGFAQDRNALVSAIVAATLKSYNSGNSELNPFTTIPTPGGLRTVMQHSGPDGKPIRYRVPVEASIGESTPVNLSNPYSTP